MLAIFISTLLLKFDRADLMVAAMSSRPRKGQFENAPTCIMLFGYLILGERFLPRLIV